MPLGVAVAYLAGAEAAFAVGTLSDRIFAPFWPPNIVILCALLLTPPPRWWIVLAAALPAHVIAEAGVGMPPAQYMIAFAANMLVATLSAAGVRQFVGGPPFFVTLRQAFFYVLIVVFACPAWVAFVGAMVRVAGDGDAAHYWTYWGQWFAANALTGVALGPLCLMWIGGANLAVLDGMRKLEAGAMLLGLAAACAAAFGIDPALLSNGFLPTLFYLPIPFIVWAAVRFGALGVSGAILVVAIVSIERNLRGATIFTGGDAEQNVLELQAFLTALSAPALLLGAAIEELRRARSAMQELAGAALRGQDDERRRVAKELHERIGQDLAAVDLTLARLEQAAPAACRPILAELEGMNRRAVGEIRAVSYLLHPPLLDEAGLALALKAYVAGLAQRSGVAVDLSLAPDLERLPADVELVLFRVIQDAVTGRHRDGDGERLRLALTRQAGAGTVTLTVEQASGAIARAWGGSELACMRERLRGVGGRVDAGVKSGRRRVIAVVPVGRGGAYE